VLRKPSAYVRVNALILRRNSVMHSSYSCDYYTGCSESRNSRWKMKFVESMINEDFMNAISKSNCWTKTHRVYAHSSVI